MDFRIAKDAAGYRQMITRGATRMAATQWKTGAAFLMLFVNKLSAMTFGQGMPELFLDYCEEHLESYKGEGLCSGDNPLDPTILTETVLARKAVSEDGETLTAALAAQSEAMDGRLRGVQGERAALARRVSELERAIEQANLTSRSRGGGLGGLRGWSRSVEAGTEAGGLS